MPRYYFRLETEGPIDLEGEELPGDAAAIELAALVARDLTKNRVGWARRQLVVFDETGRVVQERELVG